MSLNPSDLRCLAMDYVASKLTDETMRRDLEQLNAAAIDYLEVSQAAKTIMESIPSHRKKVLGADICRFAQDRIKVELLMAGKE